MVSSNRFDYNSFNNSLLEQKAKATRSNFLGFVQQTFENLVQQGSALWELYYDLLSHLGKVEGKVAFDNWLSSDEFGATRYVAKAAMEISPWYVTLPGKVQRLVMKNCHRWSLAALRELPKLAVNVVREVVSRKSKQTAQSVRDAAAAAKEISEADWEAIAEKYDLSATQRKSVEKQARIFALAEATENDIAAIVTLKHALKALEYLGFQLGKQAKRKTGNSSETVSRTRVAIATYNLSEEDERKLAELAQEQGVTPNSIISQLLKTAPKAAENAAPKVEEIEEKYLAQIAELQNQLAAITQQMALLQQQLATKNGEGKTEGEGEREGEGKTEGEGESKNEGKEVEKPSQFKVELLEATVEEICAIAPTATRRIDVLEALSDVGESTLLLVQRLIKSLKKSSQATHQSWEEDFAIDESQEIDNWEPA